MKKSIRIAGIFLAIMLVISSVYLTAVAAGVDDGIIKATEKEGKVYFGTEKSDWCTYYIAADGSGVAFYKYDTIDLTNDNVMDICDLVYLNRNASDDLNFDGTVNEEDNTLLRQVILGITDFLN